MYCFAHMKDYIEQAAKVGDKVIFASMSQLEEAVDRLTMATTYTYLGVKADGSEILVKPYKSRTTGTIRQSEFNKPIAVLEEYEAKRLPKTGAGVLFNNVSIMMMLSAQNNPDEKQYQGASNPISLVALMNKLLNESEK